MWKTKEVQYMPAEQATKVTYIRSTDMKEISIVIDNEWTIDAVVERVVPELLSLCEQHLTPEAE